MKIFLTFAVGFVFGVVAIVVHSALLPEHEFAADVVIASGWSIVGSMLVASYFRDVLGR